jgi:hypothetical protein
LFKYSSKDGEAFGENGMFCQSTAEWHDIENNLFVAPGCCAAFCQDQQGCEGYNYVYNSQSCSCSEPPSCENPQNCVSSPPCTVDQILDEACDCCKTPPEGSPILIDLGESATKFTRPEEGILFDIFANGKPAKVSWPTSEQAYWLALDRNGNGIVDSGSELFGNATRLVDGSLAPHGYAALSELDDNRDGIIDDKDPVFKRLFLWQRPLARNGFQPADRRVDLLVAGIESLNLAFAESRRQDRWGNEFRYRAKVTLANGKQHWSYDVFLVFVSVVAGSGADK